MAGWNGFTEDELKKLKTETESTDISLDKKVIKSSKVDQVQKKKVREKKIGSHSAPKVSKEVEMKTSNNSDTINIGLNSVSNEKKQIIPSSTETPDASDNHANSMENACQKNELSTQKEPNEKLLTENSFGVLSDKEGIEIEVSNLQKLQFQQKQMEEENKKKQLYIKQTLQEKFKQTQSEAVKLKAIQIQLNKLDQFLQADVEILRNKIDEACALYSQAQKRYVRAETEFVDAKLDYFVKKENKEQLTEHLYSIIQENELRKAKQLEELVQKLNDHEETVQNNNPSSSTIPHQN